MQEKYQRGTSSRLHYFVFSSSSDIKTVMVEFYPRLLSGDSVFATPEAAQNTQGASLFWCTRGTKLQHIVVT